MGNGEWGRKEFTLGVLVLDSFVFHKLR
jgi:hypothetical protein